MTTDAKQPKGGKRKIINDALYKNMGKKKKKKKKKLASGHMIEFSVKFPFSRKIYFTIFSKNASAELPLG